MNKEDGFKELQNLIEYSFKNEALLICALSHSSYKNESKMMDDYERLEFLGDAVLELTVSEFLFRDNPTMREGDMTKMRASLVCEQTLAYCSQDISLGEYILLGKGEEKTGGRSRESIVSDVFEAIIGALYLDGGIEPARNFISKYVLTDYKSKIGFMDSKTMLQEYVQERGISLEYVLEGETGPDHERVYQVKVVIDGRDTGFGEGTSKKRAEQRAAFEAIKKISNDERRSE